MTVSDSWEVTSTSTATCLCTCCPADYRLQLHKQPLFEHTATDLYKAFDQFLQTFIDGGDLYRHQLCDIKPCPPNQMFEDYPKSKVIPPFDRKLSIRPKSLRRSRSNTKSSQKRRNTSEHNQRSKSRAVCLGCNTLPSRPLQQSLTQRATDNITDTSTGRQETKDNALVSIRTFLLDFIDNSRPGGREGSGK